MTIVGEVRARLAYLAGLSKLQRQVRRDRPLLGRRPSFLAASAFRSTLPVTVRRLLGLSSIPKHHRP